MHTFIFAAESPAVLAASFWNALFQLPGWHKSASPIASGARAPIYACRTEAHVFQKLDFWFLKQLRVLSGKD